MCRRLSSEMSQVASPAENVAVIPCLSGVESVPEADWVLVHDAARALITPQLITSIIDMALVTDAAGVIPGIPVTDTVKKVAHGQVVETLDRSSLVAVQTPQAFDRRGAGFERTRMTRRSMQPTTLHSSSASGVQSSSYRGMPTTSRSRIPKTSSGARAIAQERGAS